MSHKVICIGRQFGSGGFLIGKALSEKLGIPFYDKNIIALASERSGLSPETLEKGDERKTSQWFYMGMTDVTGATLASPPPSDVTYALQRDIILDAAKEHDCIIGGRCSDAILHQTDAKVLSVFISDTEKACRVVVPDNQLSLASGKEGQNARLAAKTAAAYCAL